MAVSDGTNRKTSPLHSQNTVNIVAIFVIAAACIIIVMLLAKSLLASNEAEVPEGINTATISTTVSGENAQAAAADESLAETSATAAAPSSSASQTAPAGPEKAYITNYVQLLEEPSEDAAHIICMSPNIEVTVLERYADGYAKVTFLNGDGTNCTGYVMATYLKGSIDETTTQAPEETAAPAETEAPSETLTPETTAAAAENAEQ